MKNVLLFVGGMITGAVLLVIISLIIARMSNSQIQQEATETKASLYEDFENGEIINEKSFQVFQVLEDNAALVNGQNEYNLYIGPIYLLIGKEGTTFYDDQIVNVPQGSVVRMNGTFHYETRNGIGKTVPKIMILEEKK